jgi:hypothetical protein
VGLRVQADQKVLGELQAGDLYSPASQGDWDLILNPPITISTAVVGHRVLLRSNDALPDDMAQQVVYKLTVIQDDAK